MMNPAIMMMLARPRSNTSYYHSSYTRNHYHRSKKKREESKENKGEEKMDKQSLETAIIDKLFETPCYITLHKFFRICSSDEQSNNKVYDIGYDGSDKTSSNLKRIYNVTVENNEVKKSKASICVDVKDLLYFEDQVDTSTTSGNTTYYGKYCKLFFSKESSIPSTPVLETAEEVKQKIEEAVENRLKMINNAFVDIFKSFNTTL